jgi:hypothetical protein
MWKRREKLKVVEVLSLHCLDREPRPGAQNNRWVAEVKAEVRGPVYAHPARIIKRTVTILAKDELEAFIKLLTEGA